MVFYTSVIAVMHGPINIRFLCIYCLRNTYQNEGEFVGSVTLKPVLNIQLKYEWQDREKLTYSSPTTFTKTLLSFQSIQLACVSLRFAWLDLAVASWTDLRSVQIAHHVEEVQCLKPQDGHEPREDVIKKEAIYIGSLRFLTSLPPYLSQRLLRPIVFYVKIDLKLGGLQLRPTEGPCIFVSVTWHQTTYCSWEKLVFPNRTHKI